MSIVAYVGLPGSGKSYGVVENVVVPALKDGRTIVTNIPLKKGTLQDEYPKGKIISFEPDVDSTFWNLDNQPKGAVFIIDEAWRYWASGLKASNMPEHEKQFFTEHRHVVGEDGKTNELVLVTQDLQQIAAFVRNLIEETYRARKLSGVGRSNNYRVDVYAGAVTGQKPPGQPIRQLFGKYKPEIFRFYKSHTHNKTDFAAGMEEKPDKRANLLKSPLILFGIPGALLLLAASVWSLWGFFHPEIPEDDATPTAVPNQTLPPGRAQAVSLQAQQQQVRQRIQEAHSQQLRYELDKDRLPLSESWRITGQINNTLIVSHETRGDRFIDRRKCGFYMNTEEVYCVIEGKLVTWYSAKRPEQEFNEVNASPEFNF